MTLSLYEPFDFDRIFYDWTDWPAFSWPPSTWTDRGTRGRRRGVEDTGPRVFRPAMDLVEDPKGNTVTAVFELPGVKKEDVGIDVTNNRLTVSAEAKHEKDFEEGNVSVRERRLGRFQRTLQLPEGVRDSDVKAKMETGLLVVQFPKSGPEQAPKRITVH